jgi:hypothetical protein
MKTISVKEAMWRTGTTLSRERFIRLCEDMGAYEEGRVNLQAFYGAHVPITKPPKIRIMGTVNL